MGGYYIGMFGHCWRIPMRQLASPLTIARTPPSALGNSSSGMPLAALLIVQHVELNILVIFIHWNRCKTSFY